MDTIKEKLSFIKTENTHLGHLKMKTFKVIIQTVFISSELDT